MESRSSGVEDFPNFNVYKNLLGILSKCRFWVHRSGKSLEFCISLKLSGDAKTAGPQAAL